MKDINQELKFAESHIAVINKHKKDEDEDRWTKGVISLSDKFKSSVEKFKRRVLNDKNNDEERRKSNHEEFKI